ncbi:MAG: hypothetical protein IJ524_03325 [Bacteroidales bacterium]|nr:hypothetical protein [Bacteroidales bacterium]
MLSKKELDNLRQRYEERSAQIRSASVDDLIRESPAEQEARINRLLQPENYALFFDYYFGPSSALPLADHISAPFHVDIYRDLYQNNYITIFNALFRGGAKSTHANLGYPLALKQTGKCKFFLVVGANEERAAMLLQDLQLQLEANPRIIADFGPQKSVGDWADGLFQTTDRCTFMSLGIDQPARGLRANGIRLEYVSVDDIEDPKRALNTDLCIEYANKVTGDIQAAFSINSERTIINNNYFVEKGFIGELLKRKGFDMKNVDTRHNNIITKGRSKLYQINLTDRYYNEVAPDNPDWHPSWDRFSREYCLRKVEDYAHDLATLSNEYYNTPVKVGRLFKPEHIRWVKHAPLSSYDLILDFWDFSYTRTGDTKAMARIGARGNKLTLIGLFCRRCDIEAALQEHFTGSIDVVRRNASYVAYYDANVAQQAIYEPVLAEAAARYHSAYIPVPTHNTTDKYVKIATIIGASLFNGTLYFDEAIKNNPDWDEAAFQFFGFEKGSRINDDWPDALAEAIGLAKQHIVDISPQFKPVIAKRKRSKY